MGQVESDRLERLLRARLSTLGLRILVVTDKQQGWNGGLDIVLRAFNEVAWQKGLVHKRYRAASEMEKQVEGKCHGRSEDYRQVMGDLVTPFRSMLKGQSYSHFDTPIPLPEVEKRGRNDALEIVLDTFRGFVERNGLKMDRSCSEIADEMEQLVGYEGLRNSQDYWNAMAEIVLPFYRVLKGKETGESPFNT